MDSGSNLEAVVSDDGYECDDGVQNCQAGHSGLHVSCALFQEKVNVTFLVVIPDIISTRALELLTGTFKQTRAFKNTRAFKVFSIGRRI